MESERNIQIRMITSDEMPETVKGCCLKLSGPDDYLILINGERPEQDQLVAFLHECLHIWHKDHEREVSAQDIEMERHKEIKEIIEAMQH